MDTREVKIILSNGIAIDLELYPDIAPLTVENFINTNTSKHIDIDYYMELDYLGLDLENIPNEISEIDADNYLKIVKDSFEELKNFWIQSKKEEKTISPFLINSSDIQYFIILKAKEFSDSKISIPKVSHFFNFL